MSLVDPKNPEAFWDELLKTDPEAAAPKLMKWKKSPSGTMYLDHVRPQTRSMIDFDGNRETVIELEEKSKSRGYKKLNFYDNVKAK